MGYQRKVKITDWKLNISEHVRFQVLTVASIALMTEAASTSETPVKLLPDYTAQQSRR
jgi:hypothetical protein